VAAAPRQGVLPGRDVALAGADGDAGDDNALEEPVRIALQHERSMNAPGSPSSPLQTKMRGVSFVGRKRHFRPREASAAPAGADWIPSPR
jgi:hypothetical protein